MQSHCGCPQLPLKAGRAQLSFHSLLRALCPLRPRRQPPPKAVETATPAAAERQQKQRQQSKSSKQQQQQQQPQSPPSLSRMPPPPSVSSAAAQQQQQSKPEKRQQQEEEEEEEESKLQQQQQEEAAEGERLARWFISECLTADFFKTAWEQKHCVWRKEELSGSPLGPDLIDPVTATLLSLPCSSKLS